MSGIPIQGTLYESGVGAALCRLDNIPEVVWDGTLPFSTIYANCNLSTIANEVVISLKGTGHTIDNKGSAYTNMNVVSFSSIDIARTINIADGATMTSLPDLFAQVTLNSQSSSFVVVDPTAVKPFYVGRACWLSCGSSCKFVSLTGSTNIIIRLSGGYVYGPQVFDLAGSSVLNIFSDEIPYIGATSFYGTSGTSLNFTYSSDTPIPLKSQLIHFAGTVAYIPSCDNGNLKNVATIKWDGTVAFSDFYRQQNIATLTGSLIISLIGTGHIIDSLGATYTNMKYVAFQSLDGVRIVNIAQNAVIDNVPTLINNVTLQSYSTASICTNPTATINVGFGCTLACYSGVSGAKFVSLTTTHSATCFLNSGTFSGIEVFQLANTSNLHIAALNISDIDADSIYGISGTNLYLNYDAGSVIPSPTDFSNFAGTVHYLTMASSSKIQGGELQLANLAALNAWPFISQLVVGQWGCAQDTGKKYRLTSTSPVTWVEFVEGADLNSITQIIGQSNPEASNFYFENITTQGTSSNNAIPLKVLDVVSHGSTEYDATITVNSTTEPVIHAAFMLPTSMDDMAGFIKGEYAAKVWASVDTPNYNTQLLFNAMNWHTYAGLLATTTGTGTTRTISISPLNTVFSAGDVNADPTLASYVETPQGRYQIIAFNTFYSVDIAVPSGYVNESSVVFSKYTIIAHWATANIVSNSLQLYACFSSVRDEQSPATSAWGWSTQFGYDKLAIFVWGITTSPGNVVITFAYGGSTTCSKIETPRKLMVDSREIEADHDSIVLNYNVLSPLYLSSTPIPWSIPWEAKYILDAQIMLFANGASVTTDIDLTTNYTNDVNGSISQYSATDTTTLYDILGPDLVNRISFLPLITNAQRDTIGTIVLTRQDMSPAIYVTKTKIYYYY
jgi:hypothetical protein